MKKILIILAIMVALFIACFVYLFSFKNYIQNDLKVDLDDEALANADLNIKIAIDESWIEDVKLENSILQLTDLDSYEMKKGTHRPEIMYYKNKIYLIVVEHEGDVRHKGYILDQDLEIESSFVVSEITSDYGAGADHRFTIIDDKLIVVYQSLIRKEDEAKATPGGPSEAHAKNQSLMLAQFSLDGEELNRAVIFDKKTDFSEYNFPDFTILPYGDNLLVSTGGELLYKLTEVSLAEDNFAGIISEQTEQLDSESLASAIGNSLFQTEDKGVGLMSSKQQMGGEAPLTFIPISDDLVPEKGKKVLEGDNLERTFPTGVKYLNGYYLVGYIAREVTDDFTLENNPYYPYLAIFNSDWELVDDRQVSEQPGSGHVHPTLTVMNSQTVLLAWSAKNENLNTGSGPVSQPQVFIEEYKIEFIEK